jgi:Rrf2 family nitric oxide-sensitive transcriptional repressor
MISQTVEYALRAVVALAYRHDAPMTGQEIAEMTRVPAPYLLKLMQQLVRARLVYSQRGRGGGFTLTRSPSEITIWDIVQAVDALERIRACPLGIQGHGTLCALHQRLDQAIEQVETAFRKSTLAELLAESNDSSPLCEEVQVLQSISLSPTKAPAKSKAAPKKAAAKKSAGKPKQKRKKSQ